MIGAVERAHVKALRDVLGSKAIKAPFFDFKGTTEDPDAFLRTAVAFEDLAVAAYKGQAPQITSPEVLAAAISIHSVEARHAAWIRYLAGSQPATDAFDKPLSRSAATKIVNDTGFIVVAPADHVLAQAEVHGIAVRLLLLLPLAVAGSAVAVAAGAASAAPPGEARHRERPRRPPPAGAPRHLAAPPAAFAVPAPQALAGDGATWAPVPAQAASTAARRRRPGRRDGGGRRRPWTPATSSRCSIAARPAAGWVRVRIASLPNSRTGWCRARRSAATPRSTCAS